VPVGAADGAEPAAIGAAQRLHGKGQVRLAPQQPRHVERVALVEIQLEVVRRQLDLLVADAGRGDQVQVDVRADVRDAGLQAPAGLQPGGGLEAGGHHHVAAPALGGEADRVQAPPLLREDGAEIPGRLDLETLVRDFGDVDDHPLTNLVTYNKPCDPQ